MSADPSGGSVPIVHAHRESGTHDFGILLHHEGQLQLIGSSAGHRSTDYATGVVNEEAHLFFGRKLCGHDEIALVFPILVVDHNHDLAAPNSRKGIGNGIEYVSMAFGIRDVFRLVRILGSLDFGFAHLCPSSSFSAYFAITSTSMFTLSPTPL